VNDNYPKLRAILRRPQILAFVCIIASHQAYTAQAYAAEVDFAHEVVPIFRQHCAECHTGEAKKGGFSVNDRESLLRGSENGSMVTVGNSMESYLIELVTSTDADLRMPPKGSRLSDKEISILRRWIDDGVSWEEGFAFKKPVYEPPLAPRRPELPPARDGRNHPIDRILDQYLSERSLPRPKRTDDSVFLRRSSLDLIGLIPNATDVQQFLSETEPQKRLHWVESLLNDDIGYADHWLTFWNDLLRNDYSGTGFITGGRSQISRWLYQALLENKSFDQFARELIAPKNNESRGFIDGIKWRGDVSAGQTVEIQFAQSVAQSFLGINIKCASCHDSFVDRWKLSDAYGLAAIYATKPLDIARCDKATGEQAQAAWIFPEIGQVDPKATQEKRLEQLADLLTSPKNGRFARTIVNRLWYRMMGRGLVHPVDSMQSEPWSHDLLDHLATVFVDENYDLRKMLAYIATSEAYQSNSERIVQEMDDSAFQYAGPRAKRLTSEQFVDAIWTITGAGPRKFDAPVFRGLVDNEIVRKTEITGKWIWGDVNGDANGDAREVKKKRGAATSLLFRKTLQIEGAITVAGAIVTANQEFTLFVNQRQVAKADDWKTIEVVSLQSALKKGENTIDIVASGPEGNADGAGVFFESKIVLKNGRTMAIVSDDSWGTTACAPAMNEKRFAAIDKESLGSAKLIKPLSEMAELIRLQGPLLLARSTAFDERMPRASLMKNDFLMRTLGRPNRDQIVSMRPNDLTTLEAIDLANGQILTDALAVGAKTLMAEAWMSPADLVSYVYRNALTREPNRDELTISLQILDDPISEQAIQDLLWTISMTPEFHYVR